MFVLSYITGVLLGSYLGLLIVQYGHNGKTNPINMAVKDDTSEYEIRKEFERNDVV